MLMYITVKTFQGIIESPCCYISENLAKKEEQKWLKLNNINTELDREIKANSGTEFKIFETQTIE